MFMQWILDHMRFLSAVLIGALLLEMAPAGIAYGAGKVRVQNVRMERAGHRLVIFYDLIGDMDEKYSVTITLKREEMVLFKYTPKNLSGDCGEDVTSGTDKKVVWDYQREFPQGLIGEDYFVVVEAEVESSGVSAFVWIGGGAALAGAAAFLLFAKKSNVGQSAASNAGFPAEPGRPR